MAQTAEHKNQEFVLANRPSGVSDITTTWKLQEASMPHVSGPGQFVSQSLYISVDPYLSSGIKKSALGGVSNELGSVQLSGAVAKVIESTNDKFPVGAVFEARIPWRKFNLFTEAPVRYKILKNPGENDTLFDQVGLSHALGVLGMPSQTAFYGAMEVLKLSSEDILVVSGAAGAVGHVVGQIAKRIHNVSLVIGTAGGKHKTEKLKEFGFDYAIDYKEYDTKEKMAKRILELTGGKAPNKYFDNTSGHVTDAFFDICARKSLIVVCGAISSYNENEAEANHYPNYLAKTIYKALTIQGYVWSDYFMRNDKEFFPVMGQWIKEGKIKYEETLVEGFDQLPRAYKMLFTGENIGKIVVKV